MSLSLRPSADSAVVPPLRFDPSSPSHATMSFQLASASAAAKVSRQSLTISEGGQDAIRRVFGFDPGADAGGAYTYDTAPAPAGGGFNGNASDQYSDGLARAYVYPSAGQSGVDLGLTSAQGVDRIATQEVAQKLVFGVVNEGRYSMSDSGGEIVGDAVSLVQYPQAQTIDMLRVTAQSELLPGTTPERYALTQDATLQVLGSVAARYGGQGGAAGGRTFLDGAVNSIARSGRVNLLELTPETLGAYASATLGADPDAFNAALVSNMRDSYVSIAQQLITQARP